MAETATSESASPASDRDFDPTADMMVHDFDDERTMEEEEACSNEDAGDELNDLKREGEMSIEDLMAMYGSANQSGLDPEDKGHSPPPCDSHDTRSSSEEEILSNRDLTLDKDEVAKDLLQDGDGETPDAANVNELLDSVDMPSQTVRLLRSSDQGVSDSEDDSDDEDYQPEREEDWKKVIQVGSDYQARIPAGLSAYGDAPAYENEDRLLWDPNKLEDSAVRHYLDSIQRQRAVDGLNGIPEGAHIKDDEQDLYLLLQCGQNVEEALRRRKMQAVQPTDPMSLWSEEECRNFENGLRLYGKNFHLVQQNKVKTRSVGELVQFYYLWKKTERHDVFASKTRLEKRKYALHPGLTDYMNRILDEQENPSRERASSPSPYHMLMLGDHKRQSIQPLSPGTQLKQHLSHEEMATAMQLVEKVVSEHDVTLQHDVTGLAMGHALLGHAQPAFPAIDGHVTDDAPCTSEGRCGSEARDQNEAPCTSQGHCESEASCTSEGHCGNEARSQNEAHCASGSEARSENEARDAGEGHSSADRVTFTLDTSEPDCKRPRLDDLSDSAERPSGDLPNSQGHANTADSSDSAKPSLGDGTAAEVTSPRPDSQGHAEVSEGHAPAQSCDVSSASAAAASELVVTAHAQLRGDAQVRGDILQVPISAVTKPVIAEADSASPDTAVALATE